MLVVAMQKDSFAVDALSHLNDWNRNCNVHWASVSKTLEGGCTAPIGALARYNEKEDTIHFQGFVFAWRKEKIEVDKVVPIEEWKN
jgi:hydroxymethylbilane synthase